MTDEEARPDTKREATRARVLDAAAAVFRERGYAGVRLVDIAERAQMQAGSLYYHFDSREDLVGEVLQIGHARMVDLMRDHMQALPPDTSDVDRLREAMAAHVVALLGSGDAISAALRIVGQVPDEIRRPVLHGQAAYGAFWHQLLASAQDSGAIRGDADLSAVRMLLVGGLNSPTDWYRRPKAQPPERLAAGLAEMCLTGLARERATDRPRPAPSARATSESGSTATTRKEATRRRILHAAAATFADQGYAAARLVDIATEAGMRTGSLYYHFASREELVTELLTIATHETHEAVAVRVDDLPPTASHLDRVVAAITAHLGSIWAPGSNAPALVRIFANVPQDVRDRVKGPRGAYSAMWEELVQRAIDAHEVVSDLSARDLLSVINGAMNWTVEWYRPGGRLTHDDVARELSRLVLDGLLPLDGTSKSN
jgi:AcrR family transcriptional regulator